MLFLDQNLMFFPMLLFFSVNLIFEQENGWNYSSKWYLHLTCILAYLTKLPGKNYTNRKSLKFSARNNINILCYLCICT
jgi:hypothetical protein